MHLKCLSLFYIRKLLFYKTHTLLNLDFCVSSCFTVFSFLYFLKDKTFFCDECKRKKPDPHKPNITQCMCNKSHRGSYDSWQIFIEREDLIVWRRPLNGYYEYKVYGSYDDVTAIDFLDTQIDTEYRKKWDNTAVTLEIVEKDKDSNSDILYWEMLWPVKNFCFVIFCLYHYFLCSAYLLIETTFLTEDT